MRMRMYDTTVPWKYADTYRHTDIHARMYCMYDVTVPWKYAGTCRSAQANLWQLSLLTLGLATRSCHSFSLQPAYTAWIIGNKKKKQCVCTSLCVYVSMCVCMYVCMHVCMYFCMHYLFTHAYAYTHRNINTRTYNIQHPNQKHKKNKCITLYYKRESRV